MGNNPPTHHTKNHMKKAHNITLNKELNRIDNHIDDDDEYR